MLYYLILLLYCCYIICLGSSKMATFKGKVVIVTGASAGIGAATAKALAEAGAKVRIVTFCLYKIQFREN